MKKFIAGFLCCLFMFGVVNAAEQFTAQKVNYNVIVDGQTVKEWGDVPPMNVNGRTMLPLAKTGEILGVDVKWDGKQVVVGDVTPIPATTPVPNPTQEVKAVSNNIVYKGSMVVDGLKIEISGKIDTGSTRRVHVFKLTNTTKTNQTYDANIISCNTGSTYIFETSPIDGISPLTNGTIKPGESIIGVIAFSNSDLATNAPEFKYKSNKLRIAD